MNWKKFWEDHKGEIIATGAVIVAGAVLGYGIAKNAQKPMVDLEGKNVISLVPGDTYMSLEKVKEILDLNEGKDSCYAIFKEFSEPDKYVCIMLDDNVVLSGEEA